MSKSTSPVKAVTINIAEAVGLTKAQVLALEKKWSEDVSHACGSSGAKIVFTGWIGWEWTNEGESTAILSDFRVEG